MRYLHTMLRVKDLDESVAFYKLLGLQEVRRRDSEAGRYTLVFLAPEGQEEAQLQGAEKISGQQTSDDAPLAGGGGDEAQEAETAAAEGEDEEDETVRFEE